MILRTLGQRKNCLGPCEIKAITASVGHEFCGTITLSLIGFKTNRQTSQRSLNLCGRSRQTAGMWRRDVEPEQPNRAEDQQNPPNSRFLEIKTMGEIPHGARLPQSLKCMPGWGLVWPIRQTCAPAT